VSETARLLARVTAGLYARGLITASGGNLSVRDPDSPDQIWITPAGRFKCDLQPEHMACIGLDDEPRSADDPRPSTEWRVHRAIYRTRPDVWGVAHTHAPQAMRLALTGTRFLPISLEAALIGELPVVPFLMPGTEALAEAVASALGAGAAVLMQNHGLVVAADSLEHAAALTETIEVTAGTLLTCRMLGVTPPVLSEDEIREARARGSYGG
jgi:ribulose-5-phosphate 4-epimerase/fuculose-1-phosphate aldolase